MSDALLGSELSLTAKVTIAAVLVVSFVYSVVIASQILLWVWLVAVAVVLVLGIRLVVAFLRLVDAVERIADELERSDRKPR